MIKNISSEEWKLISTLRSCVQAEGEVTPFSVLNASRRDEWISNTLSAFVSGKRILDAGAGQCQYKDKCGHLDYVSQDINEYTGDGEAGLHVAGWDFSEIDVRCDIVEMPFSDGEFDYVMCTEVLEHVPDPVAAVREMSRVLKSGGQILISSPFCSLTHFAPYHYATGFSRYFYEKHLTDLGFGEIEIETNGNFFEFVGQEVERVPEMATKFTAGAEDEGSQLLLQSVGEFLRQNSLKDEGSDELLCFGIHVLATKG